jgi:predicted permease
MAVSMSHFHVMIFAVQILMIGIILTIILQMAFSNKYDLRLSQSSTILTHVSALVFLIIIVILFARWLKSRKNS